MIWNLGKYSYKSAWQTLLISVTLLKTDCFIDKPLKDNPWDNHFLNSKLEYCPHYQRFSQTFFPSMQCIISSTLADGDKLYQKARNPNQHLFT